MTRVLGIVVIYLIMCMSVGHASPARAEAAAGADRPELVLRAAYFETKGAHEISGMAWRDGAMLVVSDNAEDAYVYRVAREGRRFTLKPSVRLKSLKGMDAYMADLAKETRLAAANRRLDLEALAVCGDTLYVANEGARHVLEIKGGAVRKLSLGFSAAQEELLWQGGANAGWEGMTVDCAGGRLFLAKERDPRRLFVLDVATGAVIKEGDLPGSDRIGQVVINPWTGQGLFPVGPDFSDLAFADGYLYVLERNSYEIAKVNPATFTVLARVSYWASEKGLYDTGEPFGIAEALMVRGDEITIGFDNNGTPLSARTQKTHGVSGNGGAYMTFARPAGF